MNNTKKKTKVLLLQYLRFSKNSSNIIDLLLFDAKHSKVMEELLKKKTKSSNATIKPNFNNNFKSFYDFTYGKNYRNRNNFYESNLHDRVDWVVLKYMETRGENFKFKGFRINLNYTKIENTTFKDILSEIAREFKSFISELQSQLISCLTDLMDIFIYFVSSPPFNCSNWFDVINTFVLMPIGILLFIYSYYSPFKNVLTLEKLAAVLFYTSPFKKPVPLNKLNLLPLFYNNLSGLFSLLYIIYNSVYNKLTANPLDMKLKSVIKIDNSDVFVYEIKEKTPESEEDTEYTWLGLFYAISFPVIYTLHFLCMMDYFSSHQTMIVMSICVSYYITAYFPWLFTNCLKILLKSK